MNPTGRRDFMRLALRTVIAALAGATGWAAYHKRRTCRTVWQIDPHTCTQCGRCAEACVLKPSAVKCVHAFAMCGYCKLCFGYFQPDAPALTEAGENQLCPTGAIRRAFVEDPYFEYTVDEPRCIGCGLCVKGCGSFGNGSLYLQIRHDRCVDCNICAIATACPAQAIRRVPAETPCLPKDAAPGTCRPAPPPLARTPRGRTGWTALLLAVLLPLAAQAAESRFPQPQFDTGHAVPTTWSPSAADLLTPATDVAVLALALGLAAWLVLRYRRRAAIWILTVLALAWFGFIRQGCICPVGATQNVADLLLGLPGGGPGLAVAFFLLPVLTALVFGRVFCGAVCPLGALQEVCIVRPLRLPKALDAALRLLPVVVLAATLWLVAVRAGYLICATDPLVPFFRRAGPLHMLAAGGGLLLLGTIVARPYCRFFCPYGVLLGWCSSLSWRHARVTPDDCVVCRLCEPVCPVGAIQAPRAPTPTRDYPAARRHLSRALAAVPLLTVLGAGAGAWAAPAVAARNPDVRLAAHLAEPPGPAATRWLDAEAFRQAGGNVDALATTVGDVRRRSLRAGLLAGGLVGLVCSLRLVRLARPACHATFTIDRGTCVSCGRCFAVCPQEQARRRRSRNPSMAPAASP